MEAASQRVRLSDHLGKGIWGTADKALPVVYGIGYVLLVIRTLPEAELGTFALIQTLFLLATGVANGFPLQPLLKFASERRDDVRELVSTAFLLNLGIIALFALLAVLVRGLLADILRAPALEQLLLLFPAMLAASFLRNFMLILLQTRYRIRQVFWMDAVHFLGSVLLIGVWQATGVFDSAEDLVVISLLSLGASSIAGYAVGRDLLAITWRPSVQHITLFWGYGKYVLGGILNYLLYANADYMVLSAAAGPAQVGIYSAVKTLVRVYDTMAQVIQMFILPATSRLASLGDMAALRVLTEKAICFGTLALLPVFIVFLAAAGPLMSVISAGRFVEAAPLLQLFGVLSFTTAATGVASNVLLGLGRSREGFLLSVVLLVSSTAFYLFLVPRWGALGATIGYLAAAVLLMVMTVRTVQRHVPFTIRDVAARVGDVTEYARARWRNAQ